MKWNKKNNQTIYKSYILSVLKPILKGNGWLLSGWWWWWSRPPSPTFKWIFFSFNSCRVFLVGICVRGSLPGFLLVPSGHWSPLIWYIYSSYVQMAWAVCSLCERPSTPLPNSAGSLHTQSGRGIMG